MKFVFLEEKHVLFPWEPFSHGLWTFKMLILKYVSWYFNYAIFIYFNYLEIMRIWRMLIFPLFHPVGFCVCILLIYFILCLLNSHICFVLCESTLYAVLTCTHDFCYYRKDIIQYLDNFLTSLVLRCSYKHLWTSLITIMRFRNRASRIL